MMKIKQWLLNDKVGFACLFLTIVSLVATITINFRPLYLWDINYLKILESYPIKKGELIKNFDQLMNYLNLPWVHTLKLTDFPVSKNGALHFYEVKRLFLLCYGVLFVTIIPSVLFVRKLIQETRLWHIIRPFQIGMGIPVILGFVMAMGFDQFFVLFHNILFNNDAWLFDPVTDPIIEVLPEAFFMHCFILFFILFEGIMFSGVMLGKKSLKKNR